MKVTVELFAFGQPGETRRVTAPQLPTKYPTVESLPPEGLKYFLNIIFQFGQNDFDPQPLPSVSAGDVILLSIGKFLVCSTGFYRFTEEEYTSYKSIERGEHIFSAMNYASNA